jgi:hypothetical protein
MTSPLFKEPTNKRKERSKRRGARGEGQEERSKRRGARGEE